MAENPKISAIDTHTGGEPTRVIVDGITDLVGRSMTERLEIFQNRMRPTEIGRCV